MFMVPLNIKTDNYLLYSMIKIKDLVIEAKKNNLKALTITDNNMYGAIEFYKECLNAGIKPIIGLEIDIDYKIILYAENYDGYKNLMKITTYKEDKKISLKYLEKVSDNLLCILPYQSRGLYNDLKKIYKDIFVSYKNEEEKSKINLKNKLYMGEILCINKGDEKYLKYLKAIKLGKNHLEVEDISNVSLLPLNTDTLNNEKVIDLCNLEIKMHNNLTPVYTNEDSYEYLKKECINGMRRIFGDYAPKKYALRLKYELDIIKKMGFCDYFLIVADYVRFAKESGILVGPGRGSAAGSLTAYVLNITTVDPLKYNLLFERFLNPDRVTMPDIDIDFEDTRREEVINYCAEKYGFKKVALIVTFGTLSCKQIIRDISRTLSIEVQKVDALSRMLNSKKTLKENYSYEVKKYLDLNPELRKVYKISLKLEGLKRHTSIHAAGVVMSRYDLDENLPLDKNNNFYISQYDKDYLEELGLLKMDFLALKNLTIITNILKEIGNLQFDDIKEDDTKALEIFKNANTTGIFQFESPGMINFLKKLKPDTFDDVVAALALYRPGPMKNINSYIRRKQGKEKIDYFHDDLKAILKPTYGIIVYQEQIMQIASTMAGFSFSKADLLRRAMSKKKEDILLKEKDKFINGAIKKGYDESIAKKVYNLIFKFAEYGFNKSHTVAYAMISYRMAYLKAHYPYIFMKNLLSQAINSEEKTKEYIYECKKNQIKIKGPDINLSDKNYKIIDNMIIYPLTNIKNIVTNAAIQIIDERKKGKFKDIFDFVSRCYGKSVNAKTLESLIFSGALDSFGITRKSLFQNIEVLINYGEIGSYLDDDILRPELEKMNEFPKKYLMEKELEVFGFYLSDHPITEYKLKYNFIDLNNIKSYFDKNIDTVIYVDKIRVIDTKNKKKMMFITGSDETSQVDIIVFPKIFEKNSNINQDDVIRVKGKVEKRYDEYQIIANNIEKIN